MPAETSRSGSGRRIAGYSVTRLLRRQPSDGVAYEATTPDDGAAVALNLLDRGRDADFAQRFLSDAERLRELDHEHVPRVLAAGRVPEGVYLVTALLEGSTLDELIAEGGGLGPGRVVRLLGEVADALDSAHAAGLLHRAVRPANVVIEERPLECAYLVDFALGRAANEAPADEEAATYASPEEVRGERAGPGSDLYSLACLAFESLTGAPPFLGDTAAAVRDAHRRDAPPRASELRPDLPPDLDAPLARGLAKAPAERPTTAAALVADLSRALLGPPVGVAPAVPSAAGGARPWSAAPPAPSTAGGAPAMERDVRPRSKPAAAGPWAAPPAPAVPSSGPLAALRRASLPLPVPATRPALLRAVSPRVSPGLAAGLVAVAAVAGYLVGSPAGERHTQASSGAVELTVPDTWTRAAGPVPIRALDLAERVAIRPRAGDSGLVVGIERGASVVFPGRVAERFERGAPRPHPVRLGDFQAYRWTGLRDGGRSVTLFAAPTTAGVLAAACYAPRARPTRVLSTCEGAAGSLSAGGARPTSLGESQAYASRLGRVVDVLNRRRASGRAELRAAQTPAAQARAAARLANAHLAAARSLERGPPPSEAVDRASGSVVTALVRVAVAYRALGRAARHAGGSGYDAAKRLVVRRERTLRVVLRSP